MWIKDLDKSLVNFDSIESVKIEMPSAGNYFVMARGNEDSTYILWRGDYQSCEVFLFDLEKKLGGGENK